MANGQCKECGAEGYEYKSSERGVRMLNLCRPCLNSRRRANYSPSRQRGYSLWKRYGITSEQFDAILEAQGGCAACGSPTTDGKYWHVDHDHTCCDTQARSCGKCIRGILCHGCNTALGNVGDDPNRLRALIAYLEK